MADTEDHSVQPGGESIPSTEQIAARLDVTERKVKLQAWLNVILALAVLVCAAGWLAGWLATSWDRTATERNGRVGDCRAAAQAERLDDFSDIVNSDASDEEKEQAAKDITNGDDLTVSYQRCIDNEEESSNE